MPNYILRSAAQPDILARRHAYREACLKARDLANEDGFPVEVWLDNRGRMERLDVRYPADIHRAGRLP